MALANIVNGLPKPEAKSKARATLVVATGSLCDQWANEIQVHCLRKSEDKKHGVGTVLQYRAGHRLSGNVQMDLELIESADIVLTTYNEVSSSYPKVVLPAELVTAQQKDEWWRKWYEDNKGLLHRANFLRVVLDESQAIKNHESKTSKACRALTAKFRWCITGMTSKALQYSIVS